MIARPFLFLCFAVASLPVVPDEGQWLPTQIREWDWEKLRARGMVLTKDEFWHPEKGGVLSATVQINGCTASFCSASGLLVTNHHCGFGAISELSTTEQNWLRDGFAAKDRAGELPAPDMVASVLKRIEDVTAVVHAAQASAGSDLERWQVTQQTLAKLVADGEKKEANTKCSVASFLEGKEYHLYYRTQITDVRLVYAPPRAIGEFGGEVDNWEWPRHTGDFTFFRAYVAPDGTPRKHHEENVPFQPEHWLKVSPDGMHTGDLAIITGYPGATQRYKSSRGVATRQGYVYPKRDTVLTAGIAVLERAAATSEATALELSDRIKSLANVQKNARGMVFGLARNGTVEQKLADEQALGKWIAADAQRREKWSGVVEQVLAMDEEEAATIQKDTLLWFLQALGAEAPLLMVSIEACASAAASPEGKVAPRWMRALGSPQLDAEMDLLQKPMLGVILGEIAALSAEQRLAGTEALGAATGENGAPPGGEALAADLLARTKMTDPEARKELFGKGKDAIAASDDPFVVLARGLAQERTASQQRSRERLGKNLVVGRRWIEAWEAFRGKTFYPDANSTLRVSIASVKGYAPRDGIVYTPHTTVGGLVAKETGKEPFANPEAVLAAAKERKSSRWFDRKLGDVPVCFLVDGDTTGGNSGSPVMDGKGRLVGLNFDRVFEGVAGDFGWNADRSRNVVCDIRYVLWVLESVCPSPSLLRELGM